LNVVKLWKDTGSVDPRPRGGFRYGKLKPHKAFILGIVAERPDITMPELAEVLLAVRNVKIDPSNLSKFLIACGLSYKKTFWQPSKTGLTSSKRGWNGWRVASLSCVNRRHG
jgi:transposase